MFANYLWQRIGGMDIHVTQFLTSPSDILVAYLMRRVLLISFIGQVSKAFPDLEIKNGKAKVLQVPLVFSSETLLLNAMTADLYFAAGRRALDRFQKMCWTLCHKYRICFGIQHV